MTHTPSSIPKRWSVFKVALIAIVPVMLVACAGNQTPEATRTPRPVPISTIPPATNRSLLEEIWTTIDDYYIYSEMNSDTWLAARTEYLARVTDSMSEEELATLVREMLTELPDGAASWQTRAERIEEESTDTATYEGIGAVVAFLDDPLPRLVILSVAPGSPAERAGVNAHDSVISVDGMPITGQEGVGAVSRIRGPAGTEVTLMLRSPDGQDRTVTVTRGQLGLTARKIFELSDDGSTGYLLMPTFVYDNLTQDVAAVVQAISVAEEPKGLVIDLRVAGGSQWPAGEMATLFSDGDFGGLYTRGGVVPFTVEGQDIASSQTLPLVILVGRHTWGGAEIFAAAMQSNGRAQILGQATLGLVEGQSIFDLSDGSRLTLSTSSYHTKDGRDIGISGVTPDQVIDLGWDEVSATDDPVRDEAMRILNQ